ncbi:MAG: hypothetical protein ACI9QC_000199 [Oceanicoccus sp.]|jgi:uncharacterized protein with PQ loop repeat
MSRALGLHHISKKNRPLLGRIWDWFKKDKNLDDVMIIIAIVYPLTILPQAFKIIEIQDASSISLLSFSLKAIFAIPWVYYGIKHKSNPIILSNILWFIGYGLIIVETMIY